MIPKIAHITVMLIVIGIAYYLGNVFSDGLAKKIGMKG